MSTSDELLHHLNLVQDLEQRLTESIDNFPIEYKVARRFQSVFRGWRVREQIDEFNYYASEIQRVFRGFLGRKRAFQKLVEQLKMYREAVEFAAAANIQRVYRGHSSRTRLHSYYARKDYLRVVGEANESLMKTMDEEYAASMERWLQKRNEEAKRAFSREITRTHHLVSIAAQPGVYNPESGEVPSIFGMTMEEHLRSARPFVAKSAPKTKLFEPGDPLSLQASVPYDTVQNAERTERQLNRMKQLSSIHFVAGSTKSLPLRGPSLDAPGEKFVDTIKRNPPVHDTSIRTFDPTAPEFKYALSKHSETFDQLCRKSRSSYSERERASIAVGSGVKAVRGRRSDPTLEGEYEPVVSRPDSSRRVTSASTSRMSTVRPSSSFSSSTLNNIRSTLSLTIDLEKKPPRPIMVPLSSK